MKHAGCSKITDAIVPTLQNIPAAALHNRERTIDAFIACRQIMERAPLADPDVGPKTLQRLQAAALDENLGRHIKALTHAMEQSATLLADKVQGAETTRHPPDSG